jgi:putative transposase
VADITYVDIAQGWLYLAAVMDLHSRRMVGWAMSSTTDSSLVLSALAMPVLIRILPSGLHIRPPV